MGFFFMHLTLDGCCFRWTGHFSHLSQVRVQRWEYWVLAHLWGLQEDQVFVQNVLESQEDLWAVYQSWISQRGKSRKSTHSYPNTVSRTSHTYSFEKTTTIYKISYKMGKLLVQRFLVLCLSRLILIPIPLPHSRLTLTIIPESRSKGTSRLPPCTALMTLRR